MKSTGPKEFVEEYQKASGQKPEPSLYPTLIEEELYELLEENEGSSGELKELADLVYVIYGYAHVLGVDLDEAVKRVHENNMARMRQPDGSILRRHDGKILKNPETPKVDLTDLVEQKDKE